MNATQAQAAWCSGNSGWTTTAQQLVSLPCPSPAVWRVTAMCIHEHLAVVEFCARCFIEEGDGIPGWCGDCYDEQHAQDPDTGIWHCAGVGLLSHDCPMGPPTIERIDV